MTKCKCNLRNIVKKYKYWFDDLGRFAWAENVITGETEEVKNSVEFKEKGFGKWYYCKKCGHVGEFEDFKALKGDRERMRMKWLNDKHEMRFEKLSKCEYGYWSDDVEKNVAMYIMSGNEGLYNKSNELYNFAKDEFIFDLEEDGDGYRIKWRSPLSSSERKLITLAFDLFSGNDNVGIMELFSSLDSENRELALNAIIYRFG